MREKIEKILERIRPYIESDGGDIRLVSVDEASGVVKVSLHGACGTCPSAMMTLKGGVERAIRAECPWVKEVVAA